MDILIKGMEMPTNCFTDDCPCLNGESGYCQADKEHRYVYDDRPCSIPAADVAPVVRGKWIWDDEGYHCSECFYHGYGSTGEVLSGYWNYCPYCGAKMEEAE